MSLALTDVSVSIGRKTVVHGVRAEAGAGEVLALLGRNGAGKTTLVRGLAGLLPVRGAVVLEGRDIARLPPGPRSRLIGYVAQDLAAVAARLSVLELLVLSQNSDRLSWHATPDSLARAASVMEMLDIAAFAGSWVGELSGGQRQMVLLALALVRRPRLLLLDEPTSALDLANQLHLLGVVKDYTRREAIATVMILHDLSLAARFADGVVMLEGGRVTHAGATGEVMTEAVIGEVYGVDCRVLPVNGSVFRAVYPMAARRPFKGPPRETGPCAR